MTATVPARSATRWMPHGPFALSLSKGQTRFLVRD